MRHDFVVNVTHGDKPLPGVTVLITIFGGEEKGSKSFSGVTSSDGTVHVLSLPAGQYWLDAQFLGITAGSQCFHVGNRTSRKAKRKVTYEWGDLAPSTRQIAGTLIGPQPGNRAALLQNIRSGVVEPIPEVRLRLRNALTGTLFDTVSNHAGVFSFPMVQNGIYVLHVDSGTIPSGRDYESADLLIKVSNTATQSTLLLKWTSGGAGSCGGPSFSLEIRSIPN